MQIFRASWAPFKKKVERTCPLCVKTSRSLEISAGWRGQGRPPKTSGQTPTRLNFSSRAISVQSIAVESTRWCDYSNNSKFEGITFCLPHWINYSVFDSCMKRFLADVKEANINKDKIDKLYDYEDIAFCLYQNTEAIEDKRCYHYIRASILDEILYNEAKDELKLPAQDAREYLFLGVKSEMYYTGYNEDWDNIIEKRLYDKYGKAHENMHVIMQKCKDHLDSIRVSQKAAQNEGSSKSTSE